MWEKLEPRLFFSEHKSATERCVKGQTWTLVRRVSLLAKATGLGGIYSLLRTIIAPQASVPYKKPCFLNPKLGICY